MDKLRNLYMYLVCFVTLMMIIWGLVDAVRNTVDVLFPEDYGYYDVLKMPDGEDVESEEALELRREKDIKTQRGRETKELVNSIVIILIAIPVYSYHWKKVERKVPKI
jgi:hypothetical protein